MLSHEAVSQSDRWPAITLNTAKQQALHEVWDEATVNDNSTFLCM